MRTIKRAVLFLVALPLAWGCRDDGPEPVPPPPPRVPVGLMWGSGASGALLEDTVPLVLFYHDSVGAPIGAPRPVVSWSSSNPLILQVWSDSIAVALDTGVVVLTATSSTPPDTLAVTMEVVPRWQGNLVWSRQPAENAQPDVAVKEFPGHEIRQLNLGYPGAGSGDAYLTSNGRYAAATGTRTIAPGARLTIFVVDLVNGVTNAPLDSVQGNQISSVWLNGDTLLAYISEAATGFDIYTARPDGSNRVQRTNLGERFPPFF